MRHHGAGAGLGVAGLVGLLAVVGCASAGGGAHGGAAAGARAGEDRRAHAEARTAITQRIATTVNAIERMDVDALLGYSPREWRTADGQPVTREQMRAAVLREWAPVERTVELKVHLDSLNMVGDDAAVVFTTQRWQRILVGTDGRRHDVVTASEVEQAWGRTAGEWRGSGPARVLWAATRVDGKEARDGEGVLASRPR